MASSVTIEAAPRAGHPQTGITAGRLAGRLHGERPALVMTIIAVAALPLVGQRGPGNTAPADLFLAVAVGTTLLWAATAGHIWRTPYVMAMGLFILGGVLGAISGPVPGTGLMALVQDVVLLTWCWAVVNLCHSARNLRILLAAWVYSAIAWALLLFVGMGVGLQALSGQTERQGSRVAMTFGDPNFAANYLFISIMLVWATATPRRTGLRFAVYALLATPLVLTGSIFGLISLSLGIVVAGVLGAYRRGGAVPAITLLAFLVVVGALAASTIDPKGIQQAAAESQIAFLRDGIGRGGGESEDRGLLARESLGLYPSGGPLGEGPVSTKLRLQTENASYVKEAHDDYLASLIERGLVGFVGIVLLVFGLGYRTLSLCAARLTEGVSAVVIRPNALVGAVAGTCAAGVAYELLHMRHVWTLFAVVGALYLWGRE
jgi:hypothetical protein